MTTTNENDFLTTDKEYAKMDKLLKKTRELFDTLKALDEVGAYGSEKWADTFAKYAETFKKVHGYRPHWAR